MSPSDVLEMLGGSHYVMACADPGVRVAVEGPWLDEAVAYTAGDADTALRAALSDAADRQHYVEYPISGADPSRSIQRHVRRIGNAGFRVVSIDRPEPGVCGVLLEAGP